MRLLQREGGREVIVSYRLFVRSDDCKYRDLRDKNKMIARRMRKFQYYRVIIPGYD